MKYKVITYLLILAIPPVFCSAQNDCYQTFYQKGISQYEAHDFDGAIKSFKAAKVCLDKPANSDVDDKIFETQNGYIDAIEKERNKARSLALTAKSILELQKNNDATKAFRYAQYALEMEDNSESRAAFYESAYQFESRERKLFYKNTFPAFNKYPDGLAKATFFAADEYILVLSNLGQINAYNKQGNLLAEGQMFSRWQSSKYIQSVGDLVAMWDPQEKRLNILTFKTGKNFEDVVFSVKGPEADIDVFRLSPGGKYLAVGHDDGSSYVYDLSGKLLSKLGKSGNAIKYISFSKDEEMLALSDGHSMIELWNTNGEFIDTIPFPRSNEMTLEFSPDNKHLLVRTSARKIRLLTLQGKEILRRDNIYAMIRPDNFSPDGQFLVLGGEIINLVQGNNFGKTIQNLPEGPLQAIFSPNGEYLLTYGRSNEALLWIQRRGWQKYATLGDPSDKILSASFSNDDNYILTAGNNDQIKIWPIETYSANSVFRAGKLLQSTLIKDSVYVVTHKGNKLQVFNAKSGFWGSMSLPVEDIITQSQDGKYLLVQEEDKAGIWTFDLLGDGVNWLAGVSTYKAIKLADFSPTQKVVAIFQEGNSLNRLSIWDFENGKTRLVSGWQDGITSLEWSADGTKLMAGSMNGNVYTWDYSKGLNQIELIKNWKPHDKFPVKAIAVSPGGQYMVTSPLFEGNQKIWDAEDNFLLDLNCHCEIETVHFSTDNRFFITTDHSTAKIWDISGQLITNLNTDNSVVKRAYFSSDGRYVVTNYGDGSITIWPFDPKLIIQTMETFNIPDLSTKEKEKFGVE